MFFFRCENMDFCGFFHIFRDFQNFSSKFRKIKISRHSGGVRSSALDMFCPKDSTFDFLRKNKISDFFRRKKSSTKKISAFFCWNFEIPKSRKFPPKIWDFFFVGYFFRRKKSEILFFSQNIKNTILGVKHIQSRASNSSWVTRNLDFTIDNLKKVTLFTPKKKLSYIAKKRGAGSIEGSTLLSDRLDELESGCMDDY